MRRVGWKHLRLLATTAIGVIALGCHTVQHQQLYFAALDLDQPKDPTLKFYRILIDACSTNSRSEFAAGYYNASALREMYGGVPEGSKEAAEQNAGNTGVSGTTTYKLDPATGKLSLAPADSLYAIFYGSNAEAMAKQVQNFADSAQVGDQLGQLLGAAVYGNKFSEAQQADVLATQIKSDNAVIEQILTNSAAQFKANGANFQVNKNGLANALAKQLARSAGMPETDVPDIATNRQGFLDFLVNAMSKLSDQQKQGSKP